jgi:hypothetical protein
VSASKNSNLPVVPQPIHGTNGYEVQSPTGALLGLIERRFVRAGGKATVSVEAIGGVSEIRQVELPVAFADGRPVIRARPDDVRNLVGFVPRDRLDLWALFRARLAVIRPPLVPFSDEARHLGALIEDVRALAAETDNLSPGRVALIELAWQRLHTMHDPALAGVRLTDALLAGPDLPRVG